MHILKSNIVVGFFLLLLISYDYYNLNDHSQIEINTQVTTELVEVLPSSIIMPSSSEAPLPGMETLKISKQLDLFSITLAQLNVPIRSCKVNDKSIEELNYIEKYNFRNTNTKPVTASQSHGTTNKLPPLLATAIKDVLNSTRNSPPLYATSKKVTLNKTSNLHPLNAITSKVTLNKTSKLLPHNVTNNELAVKLTSNTKISTSSQLPPLTHLHKINKSSNKLQNITSKEVKEKEKDAGLSHIGYWQTVHSIESKQGKLLYRPRNKSRNCTYTRGPCGHHQLTVQALRDIGCKSLQCRKDRLNYNKSLKLSKKLLALNEKRLRKNGLSDLKDYQKYLIHQQGAYGIKNIIVAHKGKKVLPEKIIKNMANNSPFSFTELNQMSSKYAANKFLQHWKTKWLNEKRLIAGIKPVSTDNLVNTIFIPTFSDSEIHLALNYKF